MSVSGPAQVPRHVNRLTPQVAGDYPQSTSPKETNLATPKAVRPMLSVHAVAGVEGLVRTWAEDASR